MSQTKRGSMIETVSSTAIGYTVAVLSQIVIFPVFDITISTGTNLVIAAWFTVISLARGYCVRRIFNRLHVKGVLK